MRAIFILSSFPELIDHDYTYGYIRHGIPATCQYILSDSDHQLVFAQSFILCRTFVLTIQRTQILLSASSSFAFGHYPATVSSRSKGNGLLQPAIATPPRRHFKLRVSALQYKWLVHTSTIPHPPEVWLYVMMKHIPHSQFSLELHLNLFRSR